MDCPRCQFKNPDQFAFCGICGASLGKSCPKCGFLNKSDFKYCGECGAVLVEGQEIDSINYSVPKSYTPKPLADKILSTRKLIEGERKLVTVMFADVADYTSLSEKLDPEEVYRIMDGCFKLMLDEIHRYEGTVSKFTGDGAMALFGAPIASEDHAQRACHAALAIQRAVKGYGESVSMRYGTGFSMRIGLNSGLVVVGSIGDDLQMDYSAIGDTTNLASRLGGLATPGSVVISRNTYRFVKDFFEVQALGTVQLKGKEKPEEAYKLLREGKFETRMQAAAAKGLTMFVGRTKPLAILTEAYEKAESGLGQVVEIVGEAGIGKSRLLLEFKNRLTIHELTYLEGRCIHFGASMAYLPILDLLRSYFAVIEGESESIVRNKIKGKILQLDEKLCNALAPLEDILSLEVRDPTYLKLEPKQKRERVFEAIRDLLIRESQNKPVVLAVEDVHWIDKTSEGFLNYFIDWMANINILLILLRRPEYAHGWGSKSYFSRISLDQLDVKSSTELIKAILHEGEVAPELGRFVLNRTAGNPLFMEELLLALLENGSIEKRENQYVLGRPSDLGVPESIQGIIAARMDRLEANLKKIMQVASVIGREFAFRVLFAISDMKQEVKTSLLNLQGLEFIYQKNLFPELQYIFKHALMQEVAYNTLLLKRREEIHRSVGAAIEELYAERLEEFYEMLSYHYSRSQEFEKAYHYLRLSANKAMRNNSLWEAFRFDKESLQLLNKMEESHENNRRKLEVILSLAPLVRVLRYPEDLTEILQQGEELCRQSADERATALLYGFASQYYSFRGDIALGRSYLERSLQEADRLSDANIVAPLSYGLASSILDGNFRVIARRASRCIRLIEEGNLERKNFGTPANVYSALLGFYGLALAYLGDFTQAEEIVRKGTAFAYDLGHLFSVAMAEMFLGWVLVWRGREFLQAIQACEKSIESQNRSHATIYVPFVLCLLGLAHFFNREVPAGLECMEKGLKMQVASGLSFMLSFQNFSLSLVYKQTGDSVKSLFHAEEAVNFARKNKELWVEGLAMGQLALAEFENGKVAINKAKECARQGINISRELELKPNEAIVHLNLAELFAAAGEGKKVLENLVVARRMFQDMRMDYWLARAEKLLQTWGSDNQ